jgi:hypothetical protein
VAQPLLAVRLILPASRRESLSLSFTHSVVTGPLSFRGAQHTFRPFSNFPRDEESAVFYKHRACAFTSAHSLTTPHCHSERSGPQLRIWLSSRGRRRDRGICSSEESRRACRLGATRHVVILNGVGRSSASDRVLVRSPRSEESLPDFPAVPASLRYQILSPCPPCLCALCVKVLSSWTFPSPTISA